MGNPRRTLVGILLLASTGAVWACGPGNILRAEPDVRFLRPESAVLFIRGQGGVLRVRFDGKRRLAPFTCEPVQALVYTAESSASLVYTLKLMSQRSGFSRVQLHDVDGKLLARGTFCIFPTLKTPTKSILGQYKIELPSKVLKRLRSGKAVAVFQDYEPFEKAKPGWRHLAWVLYLEHYTMQ